MWDTIEICLKFEGGDDFGYMCSGVKKLRAGSVWQSQTTIGLSEYVKMKSATPSCKTLVLSPKNVCELDSLPTHLRTSRTPVTPGHMSFVVQCELLTTRSNCDSRKESATALLHSDALSEERNHPRRGYQAQRLSVASDFLLQNQLLSCALSPKGFGPWPAINSFFLL